MLIPVEWWLAYALLGSVVGFFAGLLGIGGGAIMVPLLVLLFDVQGLPREHLLHLAVGTSMSTILLTSLSSIRAHQRRRTIRWGIVRSMTPGIVIGGLGGAALAASLSTTALALAFTAIIFVSATNMLLDRPPPPTRQLPGALGLGTAGGVIGALSSIAAMGGGFASVPYMLWCNVPMIQAISTAAALGFPIALAGTAGFIVNGLGDSGLPPGSLGYVYLPAFAGITLTSIFIAPLGAGVAHRLPTRQLKRIFGIVLYLLVARMLVKLW